MDNVVNFPNQQEDPPREHCPRCKECWLKGQPPRHHILCRYAYGEKTELSDAAVRLAIKIERINRVTCAVDSDGCTIVSDLPEDEIPL